MTLLPIVGRELRLASRRTGTYWLRVLLGAVAVAVVGMTLVFHLLTGSRVPLGGPVLYALSFTLLMLCCGTGVFITADCLSEEKREGTLGLLFLTDLQGYDVVLGKLAATSLTSFTGLLAIVPVLGIVTFLGGVSPGEFGRVMLALLNALFFSLAAGLLASAVNVNARKARGWTAGLILLAIGGPWLAEILAGLAGIGFTPEISAISPVTTWRMAFESSYLMGRHRYWDSLLAVQLAGWVCIVLASWSLPRRWQDQARQEVEGTRVAGMAVVDSGRFGVRRRPLLDADPVMWMVTRKSWPPGIFAGVSVILLVLAGGAGLSDSSAGVVVIPIVTWGLSLIVRFSIAWQSSRFFSEARSSGALELLLCTPLTTREIIRGQWLAIRRHHLIPVIAVLCLHLIGLVTTLRAGGPAAAMAGGGLMPSWIFLGLQAYPILRFGADVVAAALVGMVIGLTARKPAHAAGLTILFVIVLPGVAACVPNLIIDLPLIFWAWDRLRREIRSQGGGRNVSRVPMPSIPPSLPPPALMKSS